MLTERTELDAARDLRIAAAAVDPSDDGDTAALPEHLARLGAALRAAGAAYETAASCVVPAAQPLDGGISDRYQRAAAAWPASPPSHERFAAALASLHAAADAARLASRRGDEARRAVDTLWQSGPRSAAGRMDKNHGAARCDPPRSVLCAIDRSANAQAAWRHAALLASPGGVVETVSESQLIRYAQRALHDGCKGHDLLVVGAGVSSYAAVLNAPIPILVARWCPLGTQVTDTILVPIDDWRQSSQAVVLAGRLAADHGGTVTILRAPPRDPSFQRAIAAGERVLLRATGAAPCVLGNERPPERSIPSAAASITASLVVLGCGTKEIDRRTAAQVVGSLGCSALVVPDGRCWRSTPCAASAIRRRAAPA